MLISKINEKLKKYGIPTEYSTIEIKDKDLIEAAQAIIKKEKPINILIGKVSNMWQIVVYILRLAVLNRKTISIYDYTELDYNISYGFTTVITGAFVTGDTVVMNKLKKIIIDKAFRGTPLIIMSHSKDIINELSDTLNSIKELTLIMEV